MIVASIFSNGLQPTFFTTDGLISNTISPDLINGNVYFIINLIIILFAAAIFNRTALQYRLVKEYTILPATFILLFQALEPTLLTTHAMPHVMSLAAGIIMAILYSSYQQNTSSEKSFIIGLLLAITGLFYARIFYLTPILLLGMIQMQTGNLRNFAALAIGIVTPYWIVWGMGLSDMTEANLSSLAISLQIPSFTTRMIPFLIVMILGLFTGVGNLINAYNENIKTRAMNGFVNILSVYTALIMIADNSHYTCYVSLLYSCVALQLGYFFTTRQEKLFKIIYFALIVLLLSALVWIYMID